MIEVCEYDTQWPRSFEAIRDVICPGLADVALAIEHVGSTSVPGLAAKPVIDIDVVTTAENVRSCIERLTRLGYIHQGDLGVPMREAFRSPANMPRHNLYVCLEGSLGLRNHLAVRDFLRKHAESALAYGDTKRRLAVRFPDDIDSYVAGKSECLARILLAAGFSSEEVDSIYAINAKPTR